MSKKILAALSMSLFLAACNSTADVTVDDEAMTDDSSSSVEAMVEDTSSSVEAMPEDSSSEAAVEGSMDAEVEVAQ